MIAYSKAFPHAVSFGRANPFPSHMLVNLDEVRTLLKKHGFNPKTATRPARQATKEELADPTIRTYQLITQAEGTPKDFLGIGCRFLLGRTYCFGERVQEEEVQEVQNTPAALPWTKASTTETLATAKKDTHIVSCEVLLGDGKVRSTETRFTSAQEADAFAAEKAAYLQDYNWVPAYPSSSSSHNAFDWMPIDELYWADAPSTYPARVVRKPV